MKRLLSGFFWFLAGIGTLTVGTVVSIILVVMLVDFDGIFPDNEHEPLPRNIVLKLDLSRGLSESAVQSPFDALASGGRTQAMYEMIEILDQASHDDRVAGLVADLSGVAFGFGQTQELRQAISRFRSQGKFAHAFADSFEGDGSIGPYYLATAFDQISLQPSGILAFMGIALEYPMLGAALRELGVSPEFYQRHEYKGAMASVSEAAMPAPIKRNLTQLVQNLFNQVSTAVADSRRLSPSTVASLMDDAPLLAGEAKANGFVDHLQYRDQALKAAIGSGGRGAGLVSVGRYIAEGFEEAEPPANKLALLTADGAIVRGDRQKFSADDPLSAGYLAKAIENARKDDEIAGMILRINSPGGSYVASDTILREIALFRESGRPVVVSMSDVAASGGYFLALEADHIIAQPGSITGSIGVVGGKVAITELLHQFKVETETISVGQNAGMFSPLHGFTEAQRRRLNVILDAIYDDFTGRVGDARQLNAAELDAVARGRVWSGEDAKRAGLIDGLGGYSEVLRLMRQSIDIAPDEKISIIRFPREQDRLDALLSLFSDGGFIALTEYLGTMAGMGHYLNRLENTLGINQVKSDGLIRTIAPSLTVR